MLGDLRDGGQVRHGSTERQEVVSGLSLQSGLEDETGCSTAAVLVEEVLKRRENRVCYGSETGPVYKRLD